MHERKVMMAKQEALRFLERVKEWETAVDADIKRERQWRKDNDNTSQVCPLTRSTQNMPREQGAMKRASMDLSRALSDLRKP